MKAHLLLCNYEEEFRELEEHNVLHLYLVIDGKQSYDLLYYPTIASDDREKYKGQIEYFVNQAFLIINAIPGLKLVVDQSVIEFIEGEEEEISKFVQRLVVEI